MQNTFFCLPARKPQRSGQSDGACVLFDCRPNAAGDGVGVHRACPLRPALRHLGLGLCHGQPNDSPWRRRRHIPPLPRLANDKYRRQRSRLIMLIAFDRGVMRAKAGFAAKRHTRLSDKVPIAAGWQDKQNGYFT